MTMTSSQQQASFLNTNGGNQMPPPPPMTNPLTPNSINPSPTISTFRPSQFQTQPSPPQPNQNPANSKYNINHPPPNLMQQFHQQQQQQLQLLQAQQYLRNQQMMNPFMNSMGNMPNMISPGTPSLPMTMPSPNVMQNAPRQQFGLYHHHNPYMNMPQQHEATHHANLTPQQRPQTPITTIGGTSAPSVASIASFTPSMASLGPTTIAQLGSMTATSGHNFASNNTHNQHSNELPHAQPTRFTNIGGGPP
eukprot:350566_1